MLTSDDLTTLKAAQNAILPDTAAVHRATTEADGLGGVTASWAPTGDAYACRISSRGIPEEYMQMAAVRGRTPWMVTLPTSADVLRTDRLVVGSRTLEVIGFTSVGAWETAKRVVCLEVT